MILSSKVEYEVWIGVPNELSQFTNTTNVYIIEIPSKIYLHKQHIIPHIILPMNLASVSGVKIIIY